MINIIRERERERERERNCKWFFDESQNKASYGE